MSIGCAKIHNEIRFDGPGIADGSAVVRRGRERTELDAGTWSVREGQLCRAWKKLGSSCSAVVSDGSKIQLFDRVGMMSIDGRIADD